MGQNQPDHGAAPSRRREGTFAKELGCVYPKEASFSNLYEAPPISERQSFKKGPCHPAGYLCANQKAGPLQAPRQAQSGDERLAQQVRVWLGGQECCSDGHLSVELSDLLLWFRREVQLEGSSLFHFTVNQF